VPPTINHTTVDENIDPSFNLTIKLRRVNVAMSNTFGFLEDSIMLVYYLKKKLEA
jgi:3-oxoacyl-[acyl-carrier-protein] synthase II